MKFSNSKIRRVNGLVAAILVATFFLHAIVGALWLHFGFSDYLAWVVWIAVGLVGSHIGLSVATSYLMLTDKQRPPSRHKKMHLVLKWASGGILFATALIHVVVGLTDKAIETRYFLLVVIALLTWHCFVGTKSLLKDLNISNRYKRSLRAFMIMVAAAICLLLLF